MTSNKGILKKAQEAEYLHKLESDFEKIEISIESKLMDSILEDRMVDLEELGQHLQKDEAITEDWFIASNEPVEDVENVTEENDYRVGSVSKNKPSGQYLEVISFDYKFTFWIDGKGKIYYDKDQIEDEKKEDDEYLFDTPGIFKMTINAGKPAQWLALIKFGEYVPEGAQISYEFQTSNDRTNWSEKTDDIKDLERSQYARVIVTMTANNKGESPKIKGLSMKFTTDEEIEEENKTIIKLKDPIKAGDIVITVPIDITQGGTTNTYEIKIKPKEDGTYEDGTYEIDASSYPNELHITPNIKVSKDGSNWENINSGNINNTYPYVSFTYDNLSIPNTTFSVKTPSISSKTVHIQTAQKIPEWITVSDLDLYADATAIGEWLSIESDEYLPSNTRLVYKFCKSNDCQNWTSWSDSITENGNSQYLWIKVYSQIEFRTVTERAKLNDIIVNYKLNNQVKKTKATVDGELPNQATIVFSNTNVTVGSNINATVTQSDGQSGIDIQNCRWVFTTNPNAIGTDSSKYTGGQFTKEKGQVLTLNCPVAGSYYLHVLSQDKAGNKRESISTGVTVQQTVKDLKNGDYVNYTTSSGKTIKCKVLYDANTEYGKSGVQIVAMSTVENVTIGSSGFTACIKSYRGAISLLNERARAYLNPTFANVARCVGTLPNNHTYEEPGVAPYGSTSWGDWPNRDNHYVSDYNQLTKLGLLHIGTDYWLGSRYADGTYSWRIFGLWMVNGPSQSKVRIVQFLWNGNGKQCICEVFVC